MYTITMDNEEIKVKKTYRRLIAVVSALILLIAAAFIASIIYNDFQEQKPAVAEAPQEEPVIEEPVISDEQEQEPDDVIEESGPPVMMARFSQLIEQNADLVGWIRVPNTVINYPVLYCKDNAYYLNHDFNKKYSAAGTPFLDMRADLLEKNQSLSTYAHYLKDGKMYSALHNYKSLNYYKENPVFVFDSLYEEGVYKIFSVFYMAGNASDKLFYNFMKAHFDSDEEFSNHINQILARSIFLTAVDVTTDDQLVLMTCCTYETDNLRLIIAGRKTRPGESYMVDTENAAANPEPLYPQKWYNAKGGRPPELPFI